MISSSVASIVNSFSQNAKAKSEEVKTPTIKTETPKNTAPYIESFRKYNSHKELRFPKAELHVTSNNDDFLNGFNDP